MARGHPAKKRKNTTGLHKGFLGSLNSASDIERSRSRAPSPDARKEDSTQCLFQYCLKADIARFEEGADDSDEVEEQSDWGEFDDEDFGSHVAAMVLEDDPKDVDWVPERLLRKKDKQRSSRKSRPMAYTKGPDVMSKSAHTQCRYAKANRNQTALTHFGFMMMPTASHPRPNPQFQQ
ncbi:hypothetical protein JB92DRAFT_3115857 [Gautieria morchelliformis]|nr:hypothetical protein JB92DRAFT_3115857 [Gautieria morchelliformis]